MHCIERDSTELLLMVVKPMLPSRRSLEVAADLNSLAKASRLDAPAELEPSANAAAYAAYVGRLGMLCTEEDDPARIEDAALRCAEKPSSHPAPGPLSRHALSCCPAGSCPPWLT